jgi:hypothetical protein
MRKTAKTIANESTKGLKCRNAKKHQEKAEARLEKVVLTLSSITRKIWSHQLLLLHVPIIIIIIIITHHDAYNCGVSDADSLLEYGLVSLYELRVELSGACQRPG